MKLLRIGTRSSALAVAQTELVIKELNKFGYSASMVTLDTKGDRVLDKALDQVGGKGLFTEELDRALLTGQVDLAVHSLKDVPTELPSELAIGAYTLAADRRDVLLSQGLALGELEGLAIGTSSLRRAAFLRHMMPSLRIVPIRGNLNTRVRKWREGQVDALVLAAAGVERLGWQSLISEYLDPQVFVPAPGQGVLAVEFAKSRDDLIPLMNRLNHADVQVIVEAERAVLDELGGVCQIPLGSYARWVGRGEIQLVAQVASVDGQSLIRGETQCAAEEALGAGQAIGRQLKEGGALDLIAETR